MKKTQILCGSVLSLGLHKRVFIITLDMTKLQKYSYTLNILYSTVRASLQHP